jgi:predicted nucleotide-binding protein
MTEEYEELLQIADRLDRLADRGREAAIQEPLERLQQATDEIGKAWSGSWLGYHANVYYENLEPPPPGAHFSQEWGLKDTYGSARLGSRGNWREYASEVVKEAVYELAENPNLEPAREFSGDAAQEFDALKSEVLSIIETELANKSDSFLSRLKDEVIELSVLSAGQVVEHLSPKGQVMTRDITAAGQGNKLPPHIAVRAEVLGIQHTLGIVQNLAKCSRQAGSHLSRQRRQRQWSERVGTNVFIGHGHPLLWRELKDFIEDRLRLPVDEFNRVPVAGVTNIARLSEMLDAAAIAFLIMTGEDEQPDGRMRARMNVVHEAGLFQGRLGFTRAIVVLEGGCEAFSNIEGLGQIRFPIGNIKAAFEEIRQVLEREGIIESG